MEAKGKTALIMGRVVLILAIAYFGFPFISQTEHQSPPGPYSEMISNFKSVLGTPDLPSEEKANIQARIDNLEKLEAERVSASKNVASRNPNQIPPTNIPTNSNDRIPDGIEENATTPSEQHDMMASNAWRKTTEKVSYLVYAGHLNINRKQGAVLVFHSDDYRLIVYRTPQVAGNVRIVSEKDMILTLKSDDGTTFLFDVVHEAFLVNGKLMQIIPGTGETLRVTPYPVP